MYVRVTRAMGFMVGNVLHTVRPAQHPQYLPDQALESDGFALAVDHGILSIVKSTVVEPQVTTPEAPAPEKPKKDKKEK